LTTGTDYIDDSTIGVGIGIGVGPPIFDERTRKFEEKSSSGELFMTPPNIPGTPPNFASSTSSIQASTGSATTPLTSGPTSFGSNGVRKKKSSWMNTLYPSYKTRSIEFKKFFPGLPPEERLVVGRSFE
jgi:hypothetical protein